MELKRTPIGIIGLGYVGLPLAVAFGKVRPVIGYDLSKERIEDLKQFHDKTMETSEDDISSAIFLQLTSDPSILQEAKIFIVSVPTPVDKNKKPNMVPLESATKTVSKYLKKGDLVIYESTVYPGCTEEFCVPLLEKNSGLRFNKDFFCGYSPERINPGDQSHRLADIVKVTSGSTEEVALLVDALYKEIIDAGTFLVSSIKVAEAAKVIENTQRDVNIALMNELSRIFNLLNIDTNEVLEAAETKWNFLPFKPGLVGGHCIGVDPYYLTYKAQQIGYEPEMILSGRKINDSVGSFIANETVRLIHEREMNLEQSKILILGLTFKENCPDIRNTKVIDIIDFFNQKKLHVDIFDPIVDLNEVKAEYNINCLKSLPKDTKYSAVIIAVAHDEFKELKAESFRSLCVPEGIVFDVKSILPLDKSDIRL